jgi:WD40 repeat protein
MMLKTSGVARLEERRSLSAQGYVSGVAWSGDGKRIAGLSDFGRKVTVWTIDGARVAVSDRRGPYVENSIAFLSDDTVLTAVSDAEQMEQGSAFCAWNVVTGSIVSVKGPEAAEQSPVERFALAADGETLAAMNGSQIALYAARDWSLRGAISARTPGRVDFAFDVALTPDGGTLAVGLLSGRVKLFDLTRPHPEADVIPVYCGSPIGVEAVAFSPDGRFLATGASMSMRAPAINVASAESGPDDAAQAPVKIWNVADRTLAAAYPGDLAPIRQLSWSPDSRSLAAAAGDNVVRVFSPAIHTRAVAVSAQYGEVDSVAFSPDGSLLAAATDDGVTLFALPRT